MTIDERLDRALRRTYGGRPWLMCVDVLPSFRHMHGVLHELGAERSFVLAARRGTGDPPGDEVDWHCLGLPPAADLVLAIHGAEGALRRLPDEALARIDAFDPTGRMEAIGIFFGNGQPVADRRMFGARPVSWQALEDKVVIDAVWDAAGVPRAPSEVVPVERTALQAAASRLDEGAGTVWAGDAREGFHGGAARTRWIQTPEQAEDAVALLAAHCDTARVMPFLDGIPCAIHGLVMPDGVVVLRPAEMLVLRRGQAFVYCRAATFWDPDDDAREQMRSCARRVGEHLRASVDYRGAFTIDGVLTADGFRPTELNPRVGAAMAMVVPGAPMSLLQYALIEGVDLGVGAEELEAHWLARADARRTGRFGTSLPQQVTETRTLQLVLDGDRFREAHDGEEPLLTVDHGPGPTGGFLNARVDTAQVPVGPSFAPMVARFARWADETLGTTIGPLTPAPDLR